jgi:hypothetical protein
MRPAAPFYRVTPPLLEGCGTKKNSFSGSGRARGSAGPLGAGREPRGPLKEALNGALRGPQKSLPGRCTNVLTQADSVIPAAPPTLLHILLLHGLLPLEQEAPVDIAVQVPSPGC